MKNLKFLLPFFILLFVYPQTSSFLKPSLFKHEKLLGVWAFESMTTIRNAKRQEITILYKDKKILKPCNLKPQAQLNMMC